MDYIENNIEQFLDEEPYEQYEPIEPKINIHNITHDDMKNGEGLRVVLWVAGCSHHCENCQNPITWDPNGGIPFTEWEISEFYEWLSKPWTQGATFSGGDPLHEKNREYIGEMMKNIKENYPGKDIWLYTGYTLTDDFKLVDGEGNKFTYDYLPYIDVLIDGRFECKIRQNDIQEGKKVYWRGSSNQRIINVKESLEKGVIVTKEV